MHYHFRVLRIYSMISKDQEQNIICTIDESGETFFGRHTAQHPAAVIRNNNKKFRTHKSKENIQRKKLGHTMVSAIKASSVTLKNLAKGARGEYCEFAYFNNGSRLKD